MKYINPQNIQNKIYLFALLLVWYFQFCTDVKGNLSETSEPSRMKIKSHLVFDTIPLNLEEITSQSDRIFSGTCTAIEEIDKDPESNVAVIKYTFEIHESIKGLNNKEEITFKQWRATAPNIQYETGKKYIIFLNPDSNIGLTSPVGFLQGQFEIKKKGVLRKKEVVINKMGNKGLSVNLKTKKKIIIDNDQFLTDYIHECSELGTPIRYKEFVKAVRILAVKGDKE